MPGLDPELSLEGLDDVPPLSPLQPISDEEAVQIIAGPPLPPSSVTLRDYVDHSETLRKLVLLGVDLSKIEKHPDAANLLLRLDFEKDIKQMLLFLKDLGIEDTQLGPFLTKNYAIFSEDLENLKTRVAYLQSKNFSKADIAQMVRNAPFLLSFSVERLDNRLGFFQKELELSVKKTRDLVIRLPRLLTGSLEPVKENLKVFQLELGFQQNEIQHMITKIPKMLTANKRKLTETFDYVHNVMRVPHHLMVRFPQVFNTRLFKVKERHLFLAYLGRAQYDPTKPNYISLDKLRPKAGRQNCACASVSPPYAPHDVTQRACALGPARPLGLTQEATLLCQVNMAGRPAVSASSKWLEGIRKWYYNAAGFNKLGLMRDDTIHENDDVKEAIRRLPENLYNDRVFRIKRALDLSMRQQILPKEQWTKYEEDKFYLEPYLKEVIRERKEREEWTKK
ncbi:hypothetical protein R6Z07M_009713 [Ovis aries]